MKTLLTSGCVNQRGAGHDNQYVGAYAIFPYEGKWQAQRHEKGRWLDLTDLRSDTENAAFNYAHDHYLSEQNKTYPHTR
ncbi:hypothetical protein [Enterobacter sp. ECC-019]|uniref:hypothetical protein n=1 Tax=Enterobacter sp. ECC-019 TaxID=3116478 RepID=UPI003754496A